MWYLILLLGVLGCSQLAAEEPVLIGTSSNSYATAFNNSRNIARNSNDERVVVYQDQVDGAAVIKLVKSRDGLNWQQPIVVANGYNPAIAVSQADSFFIIWEDSDEQAFVILGAVYDQLESGSRLAISDLDASQLGSAYPSLTITCDFLVFSATVRDSGWIFTAPINMQTEKDWTVINLGNHYQCGKTVAAADLEYQGENHFVVLWEELDFTGEMIYGLVTSISSIQEFSDQAQIIDSTFVSSGKGAVFTFPGDESRRHPSVSFRISAGGFLLITAWDLEYGMESGYYLFDYENMGFREKDGFYYFENHFIATELESFPVVDDIYIGPLTSTAILWADTGTIKYGQARRAEIDSVFDISSDNMALFPSVCYRKFKVDCFDAVWLEQNGDNYNIVYRRYEKYYGDEKYEILTTDLPDGVVGEDYSAPFYVNQPTFGAWIVEGTAPENIQIGYAQFVGGYIWIYPVKEAGVFNFSVAVGPEFPYLVPSLADTASFTLTLKDPSQHVDASMLPRQCNLHPNYPNPFNPNTTLRYDLPEPQHVQLYVYDIQGRRIKTLVDSQKPAGAHQFEWNASDLPSGTYFIQMQAGTWKVRRKCVLLK